MKAWRSFFLFTLSAGMSAAMHGQTLPHSALLLPSESAAGLPLLLPTKIPLPQTPLPDAPTPRLPGDDAVTAEANADSTTIAGESPDAEWNRESQQPLTGRQRLALFWSNSYNSPGAFAALSVSALAGQLENKPAQWSTDGNGYTRQFASAYGQLVARNVIHQGMAAASGLDPRYFACQCKGALRRSGHALKMSFATFNRSGRMTLDVPQLAGAYGSGMISTYWYPHRLYSPLVQGVQFGHEEMAEIFGDNLFHEFASDLKSALHLR
jgi:hypothetical protein